MLFIFGDKDEIFSIQNLTLAKALYSQNARRNGVINWKIYLRSKINI